MKLNNKKVKYNKEKGQIDVSFRMSRSLYDKIKTGRMVEDLGLSILAGIRAEVEEKIPTDSPALGKVKIKEKYDD